MAGIAIILQLWSVRVSIRNTEVARLQDASRYVSENLTRQLNGLNEALLHVSRDYREGRLTASSADASRQLSQLTHVIQAVRGMVVYDANGTSVASDDSTDLGRDFFSKEFLSTLRARPDAGVLYLSRPSYDNERVALHLSRAVFDPNGQFSGVVSANLDEEFFAFTVRSALFSPDMRATLAHPDGEIFVTVPAVKTRALVNVSSPCSAFAEHVASKRQTTVYEGIVKATGQDRLLVLASVKPPNLGLDNTIVFVVSRDRAAVYGPWNQQVQIYGGIYLLVLTAAIAFREFDRRRQLRAYIKEEASQKALSRTAARLERALDGAQLGLWELAVDTNQLRIDARGARMLGYEGDGTTRSSSEWTETLHPSDRQANTAAFSAHFKGHTPIYENEFRVSTPAGYVWLFSRGKITERSEQGAPQRVIGTFMDITKRKHSEAAFADAVLLQKRSGEVAKIGGWTFEVPTQTIRWTDEVYRIHELELSTPPDLANALAFYRPESRPIIDAALAAAIERGTPWDLELQMRTAKGRPIWVRLQGEAIVEDGVITRLAGALQDITSSKEAALELERLNATLSELSYQDALTGLGNRRLFDETLTAEWSRNARQESALSLLMIDIDYFKRFNDLHGHPAGDACLIQVAAVIKDTLRRAHERAIRYGGEEFAILLPETTLDGAKLVADRVLAAVASAQIPHGASPVGPYVSLSIGVASLVPSAALAPSSLTKRADMALYDAKAQGRAQVVVRHDNEDGC